MLKSLNKKVEEERLKFNNSDMPVWMIDSTINVIFANKLAKRKYPTSCKTDYFRTMLSNKKLENMGAKIRLGIPFNIEFEFDISDDMEFAVVPVRVDTEYESAYIFLVPKGILELENGEDNPYGMSVLNSTMGFAHNLHGGMCDILYSLSDMSDKLHKSGIKSVDDQIGNITHECYKITRMTENLRYRLSRFDDTVGVYKVIDLWNMLAELLDATNTVLTASGLQFEYSLPQTTVYVECIFKKLSAALLNIISNAYQFSNGKAKVRLTGRDNEDFVVITLSDNGPGIPNRVQEYIFQPFTSWSEDQKAPVGLGLGLNIARNTINELGGTIIVDSSSNGTTVAMSIPTTLKMPNDMPLFSMQEEYLQNRFSQLYIALSNVIPPPKL